MQKLKWFVSGVLSVALTTLIVLSRSHAAIPSGRGSISEVGDTAVDQKLSEIRVAKELEPSFDADIARLARLESQYQESLPSLRQVRGHSRLSAPVKRISQQSYRPSSKSSTQGQN